MKIRISVLLTLFTSAVFAQVVAIKNVNVIDVKTGKVIPNTSVIISGTTIEAVGTSGKLKIPANAQVVDGTNKYLMPGMVDAHIHFFQSGGIYTRPDALDLRMKMPYEKERAFGF